MTAMIALDIASGKELWRNNEWRDLETLRFGKKVSTQQISVKSSNWTVSSLPMISRVISAVIIMRISTPLIP